MFKFLILTLILISKIALSAPFKFINASLYPINLKYLACNPVDNESICTPEKELYLRGGGLGNFSEHESYSFIYILEISDFFGNITKFHTPNEERPSPPTSFLLKGCGASNTFISYTKNLDGEFFCFRGPKF